VAVARSVRLALAGELVPDAVNIEGGFIAEDVKPVIPLTERLGRIVTALAGSVAANLEVVVRGEIAVHDVKVLELAALKGSFADVVEDQVTFVNAPVVAAERGVTVVLATDPDLPDYRNLVDAAGTLADGAQVSVSAPLAGPASESRSWSRSTGSTSTSSRPSTWPSSAIRPAGGRSASWAACSATTRSTSPACRSAVTPAGRRPGGDDPRLGRACRRARRERCRDRRQPGPQVDWPSDPAPFSAGVSTCETPFPSFGTSAFSVACTMTEAEPTADDLRAREDRAGVDGAPR